MARDRGNPDIGTAEAVVFAWVLLLALFGPRPLADSALLTVLVVFAAGLAAPRNH